MAFNRMPLGFETWREGRGVQLLWPCHWVARFGHWRFAIRNEFQDEVAWSLLAWCPPTQHPGHLGTAPHGPGATALSGHPHYSGRQSGRGLQQPPKGALEEGVVYCSLGPRLDSI